MSKQLPKKAGRAVDPPLTDRERILMTVIDRLSSTQTLRGPRSSWSSEYYKDGTDGYYVHFAPWKEPEPGDLVLARTGHVSPWKVGFYVEKRAGGWAGAVIREIGSDLLCNYDNESFVPIIGIDPISLLEGDRRQLYVKILKAFRRGDELCYRFGGLRFEQDSAIVRIREYHGGFGNESIPFEVSFKWSKRMSVASVLKALKDGGYGTKSFRPPGWKPPERNTVPTNESTVKARHE
jgi:hypothetical protein